MVDSKKQTGTINAPLVSVVVITYNSAAYVLETLDSAKIQTYRNIELIITDDGSRDNTVEICRKWLEKNESRFVRVELLTVPENTGVPANCNRGYKAAKGEWIKGIAGDDVLLADCVENYVNFVKNDPQKLVCHSLVQKYQDSFEEKCFLGLFYPRRKFILSPGSAKKQYDLLKVCCCIQTPSVFIKKALVERVGFFDEALPLCEDWPMWLRITKCGYQFHYLNQATVKYRMSTNSITGIKSGNFISYSSYLRYGYVYKHFLFHDTCFLLRWRLRYRMKLYLFLEKYNLNQRTFLNTIIFHLIDWPVINSYLEYTYTIGLKGLFIHGFNVLKRRCTNLALFQK